MATAPVAPPAAAPAPAASAPVSAPSTPVSTPTPAPAPTPAPVASEPQSMEDKLGAAWKSAREAVPLDEPTEPVTEAAAPAPEEPAAAVTEPEVKAEPEKAVTEQPAVPEFELSLDDGDPASPESLFKELKNDPAAQKFFEDRPELKNKVMAALRRDTENRELRKIVPDIETARTMSKAAVTFQSIDNDFMSGVTEDGQPNPEGIQKFLSSWVKEAMIVDDAGKPMLDENGKYKLHPALTYTFDHIFNNKLAVLEAQAKESGDERLQEAVEILKGASSPQPEALEDVPEHLKSYADSLKAEKDAIAKAKADDARQRQESAKVAHKQSIERAESKAADSVKAQLKPAFAKAGLSEFESTAALQEIGAQVDTKLAEDGLYQSLYDSILRESPSEAREKKLMKHMLTYTNQYIGQITATVLRAAKGGALARQTEKQTTVDGQKKASTADPRGTSISAAAPGQKVSNADIEKEYSAAHDGEKPSLEYVLGEVMKRNRARPA